MPVQPGGGDFFAGLVEGGGEDAYFFASPAGAIGDFLCRSDRDAGLFSTRKIQKTGGWGKINFKRFLTVAIDLFSKYLATKTVFTFDQNIFT